MKRLLYLLLGVLLLAVVFNASAGVIGGTHDHMGIGMGPVVDMSTAPGATPGNDTLRVKPTTELPSKNNIGAFRIVCAPSHYAFDDPLVWPNQPGKSHLHTFFGATGVGAYTTENAMLLAPEVRSTCQGGTLNRSAYWVPSMIDDRTGKVVAPMFNEVYYKSDYNGIKPEQIRPIPVGFRMIAGSAKNAEPKGPFRYKCIRMTTAVPDLQTPGQMIPNCGLGYRLQAEVFFPQCVAVNEDGSPMVDSPDHKAHVSYTVAKQCPATHPYPIPAVTYVINFAAVSEPDQLLNWRLSSDMYPPALGNGGMSAHGDYVNGWDQPLFEIMQRECPGSYADCHAHLIGGGLAIF